MKEYKIMNTIIKFLYIGFRTKSSEYCSLWATNLVNLEEPSLTIRDIINTETKCMYNNLPQSIVTIMSGTVPSNEIEINILEYGQHKICSILPRIGRYAIKDRKRMNINCTYMN